MSKSVLAGLISIGIVGLICLGGYYLIKYLIKKLPMTKQRIKYAKTNNIVIQLVPPLMVFILILFGPKLKTLWTQHKTNTPNHSYVATNKLSVSESANELYFLKGLAYNWDLCKCVLTNTSQTSCDTECLCVDVKNTIDTSFYKESIQCPTGKTQKNIQSHPKELNAYKYKGVEFTETYYDDSTASCTIYNTTYKFYTQTQTTHFPDTSCNMLKRKAINQLYLDLEHSGLYYVISRTDFNNLLIQRVHSDNEFIEISNKNKR